MLGKRRHNKLILNNMVEVKNRMMTTDKKSSEKTKFFFPEYQATVEAKDREEAEKKVKKIIKKK